MKFLMIDDAPDVVEAVTLCLELKYPGATFLSAGDGKRGLELATKEEPDLIILDVGLPDLEGFEVCRRIRANSQVPILMLTVRDRDEDAARGLTVGADSYLTKPFSHIELQARVLALLRRSKGKNGVSEGAFASGDLVINYDTREVWLKGERVRLTATEFRLLFDLTHNAGRVLSHEELLTGIFGKESSGKINYLRNLVQRVRQKLGDSVSSPTLILTEPGVGYRFVTPRQQVRVS